MDILILIIGLLFLIKGKLAWVLFTIILLTTNYLGSSLSISNIPFEHNISDAGLILYLSLCFYLLNKNNFNITKTPLSKYVIIFYLFLFLSFCVDLLYNNIDFTSIVKTSRHWIFLSSIWIFSYIPRQSIRKLLNFLFIATVIISVIMLIEFFSGIQLLELEPLTLTSISGETYNRGSIPSTYVPFYLLLMFTQHYKFKLRIKYFFIILFLSVLVTSMLRSMILTIVFGIIIILFVQQKIKLKSVISALILMSILFFIVFSNANIKERFDSGFKEINSFILMDQKDVEGNFTFRILHTQERLNYITTKYQYSIFGLGNITEENFPEIFDIGLWGKSGRIIQLDTADISWSTFFIRLGFLGTFLYLIFIVRLLIYFYQIRSHNYLATTTFVYLFINIIFISFVSSSIATGQFLLLPILIYFLFERKLKLIKVEQLD